MYNYLIRKFAKGSMISDSEIHLSLEDDLHARTQKVASELGIDEAHLIETAILACLGEAEGNNQKQEREQQAKA